MNANQRESLVVHPEEQPVIEEEQPTLEEEAPCSSEEENTSEEESPSSPKTQEKIYGEGYSRHIFNLGVIPSTIEVSGLYWTSIIGFLQHLATAEELPPSTRSMFAESIYKLEHAWQGVYLGISATGVLFIALGNQYSMPAKLAQLFGYKVENEGCDLYLLSDIDVNVNGSEYENSYIWLENNQQLFYVHQGKIEEVKIDNVYLFKSVLTNNNNEDKQHLSSEEIKKHITLNGGHTPSENGNKKIFSWDTSADFLNGASRAIISGTSFLALAATIIGLSPAIAVTIALLPGNIGAQFVNYSFLTECCQLNSFAATAIAGYTAGSKAAYDMALYFNTIDQAPLRMGITKYHLYAIPSLPLRVLYLAAHILFNAHLGYTTLRTYYGKTYNLFHKQQTLVLPAKNYGSIPSNDLDEEALTNKQKSYGFWDRASIRAVTAGSYRNLGQTAGIANILAGIVSLITVLALDNPIFLIVLLPALVLFLTNMLPQISFFSDSNEVLKEKQVQPGSNYLARSISCLTDGTAGLFRICGSTKNSENHITSGNLLHKDPNPTVQ